MFWAAFVVPNQNVESPGPWSPGAQYGSPTLPHRPAKELDQSRSRHVVEWPASFRKWSPQNSPSGDNRSPLGRKASAPQLLEQREIRISEKGVVQRWDQSFSATNGLSVPPTKLSVEVKTFLGQLFDRRSISPLPCQKTASLATGTARYLMAFNDQGSSTSTCELVGNRASLKHKWRGEKRVRLCQLLTGQERHDDVPSRTAGYVCFRTTTGMRTSRHGLPIAPAPKMTIFLSSIMPIR